MAKKHKKSRGGRKVRVDFRANRSKPARKKDWTRMAAAAEGSETDAHSGERVVAKGDLSRKRTVIVSDDGANLKETRLGVVTTVFGLIAHVDDGERVWPCTVRRILRTLSMRDRQAVVVGDRVRFLAPDARDGVESEGVIESVEPRRGELKRVAGKREHTVAANVDQAIIVTSAKMPDFKPHLVDRYIVAALYGEIEPVICLNKVDLADGDDAAEMLSLYASLGYKTLATSTTENVGIDAVRDVLRDKESVVAGQSGVGKSSLLNAVQPDLGLKIGGMHEETSKGRHTTSRATLLKLDFGGYVVDTPGVRSFDLSAVPRARFEELFVEFRAHVPNCRFPDCIHIHEDGCAVKDALEAGLIHPARYESYARMFTDTEYRRGALK